MPLAKFEVYTYIIIFQSSDDEDDTLENSMLHSGIVFTHEAKIRELLEDEEDDFLDEGIRALEISGSSTTTHESLEIAPGEFYGSSRRRDQEKPSTPPPRLEEDPFSEEHAVETEDDQEAKKKDEPPEKAEVHDDKNDETTTIA